MRTSSLWLIWTVLLSVLMLAAHPAYADCASPTGKEGEFFYNLDYKVMQYCDGTDWVGMGGSSGGGGAGITDGNKGDITVSGSGSSWLINNAAVTAAKIAPDALDFTEFKDAMTLDASTDIAINGAYVFSLTNTGTGNSFVVNDQASDTTPFVIDAAGQVGIDNASPTQALDINGKATANSVILKMVNGASAPTGGGITGGSKLTPRSSAPSTCDAGTDGTLGLTSYYTTCVCRNGTGWVNNYDGTTACSWSQDNTPDAFSFTDLTAQTASTLIASNTVTITGIGPAAVSTSVTGGGTPQISINGGSWVSSGTITNGQTLQVHLTSSASSSTMLSATVTVGTVTDQWDVTTAVVDPCAGSPSAGTVCADGSVYAGISADGSNKMYTTRCDSGQTWSGSACINTRTILKWNDGSTNYYDIPAVTNCTVAGSCNALGKANSAAVAAVTGSGNGAPNQAASYCEGLTEDGKSDWYLPSLSEMNVLYTNRNAGGLSGTLGAINYWTSSEYSNSTAWYESLSTGVQDFTPKTGSTPARCVRR